VLSTPDSEEAALKAAALGIAARTIVLADHSKFRQRAVFQYGTLEDADVLITDAASQDVLESISSHQPRTIRYA
jgi:DeoR family fructose operon transcriptional repressor